MSAIENIAAETAMPAAPAAEWQARRRALARIAGAAATLLGALGLVGWAFDIVALKSVVPHTVSMKANTALLFGIAGCAVMQEASARRRSATVVLALLILAIAGATVFQQATGMNLGIDELLVLDRGAPEGVAPGRMATITAVMFMLVAAVLLLLRRAERNRRLAALRSVLCACIGATGMLGILGYVFGFELLYTGYAYGSVAIASAVGFLVLGLGLAATARATEGPGAHDERIVRTAAGFLAFATATAGLAGFCVLESQARSTVGAGLHAMIAERARHLETTVSQRSTRAQIITTRPNLLRHLRLLAADRDRPESIAVVQGVVDSFMTHGFSGISVGVADGGAIARSGTLIGAAPIEVRLDVSEEAWLVWRDGFHLRHRLALTDREGLVGTVIAEQPLENVTAMMLGADRGLKSLEFMICAPETQAFRCFPTNSQPQPSTIARIASQPAPYVDASEGASGTMVVHDDRGHRVLTAYGPVGRLGPIAVLRVNTAEIYGPFGRSLLFGLVLVASLAAGGTMLMRSQIRPLAIALDRRATELQRSTHDLEQFAYVASHDLQEPLRAVTGCIQLLERRNAGRLDEPSQQLMGHIVEGAQRMRELIQDLLVYSRINTRARPPEHVDTGLLVAEVLRELAPLLGVRHAHVATQELPVVTADPVQLRQVFQNLIANGVKFCAAAEPQVTITGERRGADWVFAVTDNGIGIDAQHFERIFVAFQRLHTRDEYPGSGVGLAVSKKIIERHGGRIWVASEPGRGSTFYFSLPATPSIAH